MLFTCEELLCYNINIFDREIFCKGEIIKVRENSYVAKFLNLKPYDEDKIVKHVFKLIAEK